MKLTNYLKLLLFNFYKLTTRITFFQNLTQLDVSENNITSLDLSALERLESIQCSKNQLLELTLNGTALQSVIAGNNSECFISL